MKLGFYTLFSFILGCLFMYVFSADFEINGKRSDKVGPCEEKIDLALGHATIDNIPILDRTLQLMDSNRLNDAKYILGNYMWWQLEDAWKKNQEYDEAMSHDLNPLLTNVYPGLRERITFESFTNFPTSYLNEMSNFVRAADAMTRVKSK